MADINALVISVLKVTLVIGLFIAIIFGYYIAIFKNKKWILNLKYSLFRKKLSEKLVTELTNAILNGKTYEEFVKEKLIKGEIKLKQVTELQYTYALIKKTIEGVK